MWIVLRVKSMRVAALSCWEDFEGEEAIEGLEEWVLPREDANYSVTSHPVREIDYQIFYFLEVMTPHFSDQCDVKIEDYTGKFFKLWK